MTIQSSEYTPENLRRILRSSHLIEAERAIGAMPIRHRRLVAGYAMDCAERVAPFLVSPNPCLAIQAGRAYLGYAYLGSDAPRMGVVHALHSAAAAAEAAQALVNALQAVLDTGMPDTCASAGIASLAARDAAENAGRGFHIEAAWQQAHLNDILASA